MNKIIPISLWLLVLVCGGAAAWFAIAGSDSNVMVGSGSETGGSVDQPGAAFSNVKWEHLQDVPRFQLTNQESQEFDSADIAGRPMTISFFFASCPTICRDLNKQVQKIRNQLNDPEMMFVTITVDPENDTPEVLKKYAGEFDANVDDWNFLTGKMHRIQQLGSHTFRVNVDKSAHTENILLVDRWGRFRDRFQWDDPYDMKRYIATAKDVLAEQQPPFGKSFSTRNVMAGIRPPNIDTVPWIKEFYLVDQDSKSFFSRDLTGRVWIGSFFFVSCPGICIEQNQYLAGLQDRLAEHPAKLVSISTDPTHDTPSRMKEYARKFGADLDRWTFLTGDEQLIERTSAEYFRAYSSGGHHSTLLFVVDRWGNVRGEFDWREPAAEIQMIELIDQLNAETVPPAKFDRVSVERSPDANRAKAGH